MATSQIVVPSHWRPFYEATGIPAAVRVGDEVILAGHTGDTADGYEPDVATQVRQTFANLSDTLLEAGVGWPEVVELHSYHVGLAAQSEVLLEIAGEFITRPFPAWTAVGVIELFDADALVEVSCRAFGRSA